MATLLGAPAHPAARRNRWGGPVALVLGVCALGTALALTLGRLGTEIPHATAELPEPVVLPAATTAADTAPTALATAVAAQSAPSAPTSGAQASDEPAPPSPEAEPRQLPPIVLHVEAPVDLDAAPNAAAVAADAGAATAAGIATAAGATTDAGSPPAPVASASASASTTPPAPPRAVSIPPYSMPCGINTCNVGEVCCNPSCGTCTRPGEGCDERACSGAITYPESQSCGMQTCNAGLSCCNPSCGICAPPGETCSQAPCS